MKNKFKIDSLVLVAFLACLPLLSAVASDGTIPGQFVFGQSFTLKNGQTMNGDLMIFGGSATIEKGATVNGNIVVFGGSLTIDGVINRDVVIFAVRPLLESLPISLAAFQPWVPPWDRSRVPWWMAKSITETFILETERMVSFRPPWRHPIRSSTSCILLLTRSWVGSRTSLANL